MSVALGSTIAAKWPASSFFLIGLFIAIERIMNGWARLILALAARAAGGAPPHAELPA